MARIQGYTEDDVDVLVDDFAVMLQTAMLRTTTRVADSLGQPLTSSLHYDIAAPVVFHLPGKHSQKAHGHKEKVSASQQAEFHSRLSSAKTGSAAYDETTTTDEFTKHGEVPLHGHDMGKAAADYQSDAYVVNGDLRDGREHDWEPDGSYERTTSAFDAAFEHEATELDSDIMLERGVEHPGRLWGSSWSESRSNVGLTWDDDGFVSTSTSHEVASNFATQRSDTKLHPVRMRILATRGQHVMRMGEHGTLPDYADEYEVVIPRRQRFRVIADHGVGKDGVYDIDVEWVGSADHITASLARNVIVAAGTRPRSNCIDDGPPVRVLRFALFEQPDGSYTAPDLKDDGLVADASSLTPADIAMITQMWQEEIDGVLTPYIAEVYAGSATQVAIGLGTAFPDSISPGVPLLPDDFALTYMKTVTNQLSGVGDELWEDVRNELLDGMHNGSSIEQIAARVQAVGNVTNREATRIARTYIHSAAEAGSITQVRFLGYDDQDVKKEWLTVHDARVRETHVHADHQTVLLHEKFSVGGWPIDHPGDLTAPASEVANCRCTTIFDIDDAPKLRCGETIVSAGGQAETCITPVQHADIHHLNPHEQQDIYEAFLEAGITPAYGGAKILKVIDEVLKKIDPQLAAKVDRDKVIAIVDKFYVAKKDTFGEKYYAWAQSAAGKKALGASAPKIPAVKTPIKVDVEVGVPAQTPAGTPATLPLPASAGKPLASDLTFTGKTVGTHGGQIYVDKDGNKWLFKPLGPYFDEARVEVGVAASRLQARVYGTRQTVYAFTMNGQKGQIQFLLDATDGFGPGGSKFDPLKLSADDVLQLQRDQVFDWMISNFDTNSANWIRLGDGTLFAIDKDSAFKHFGKDTLHWSYKPTTPLAPAKITYQSMWERFVGGSDIPMQDPSSGALGQFIDQMMAIPDAEFKTIFAQYVKLRFPGNEKAQQKFLADLLKRKHALKTDFEQLWSDAIAARAKTKGVASPIVAPTPVAATTPSAGGVVSAETSISGIKQPIKNAVWTQWLKMNGGKKVTPGFGGSKIYKQVQEFKTWAKGDAELELLTDMQIVRILDFMGSTDPAKNYEKVLMAWLDSPAGKKAVPKPHPSLVKQTFTPPALPPLPTPTPVGVVTPVLPSPAATVDAAADVLATGEKVYPLKMWNLSSNYEVGETIAYTQLKNGTFLKAVKSSDGKIVYRAKTPGSDKWEFVNSYNAPGEDVIDLISKGYAKTGEFITWSMQPSKLAAKTASHIPGKLPGDSVTVEEIFASKYIWKTDDVIATQSGSLAEYRLISNGTGGIIAQWRSNGTTEWNLFSWAASKGDLPGYTDLWKLSGDTLAKKVEGAIPGLNAGDSISAEDLYTLMQFSSLDHYGGVAYGTADGVEYRLLMTSSGPSLQSRLAESHMWKPMGTISEEKLKVVSTWKVAKKDGTAPDEHKIVTKSNATLTSEPASTQPEMKFPGKPSGAIVTPEEIFTYAGNFDVGEVISEATHHTGDNVYVYRLYWVDDTHLAMDLRVNNGSWDFYGLIKAQKDMPNFVEWYTLPNTHLHKSSTSFKQAKMSAKKATPSSVTKSGGTTTTTLDNKIKNLSFGDAVDQEDLLLHAGHFDDGVIIAYGKSYGGTEYRVWAIKGQLVYQQKKSTSKTWSPVTSATHTYHLPYVKKWTIAPPGDTVTKAQLTAAKKKLAPKPTVPKPPTSKPYGGYTPTPSPKAAPYVPAHVDLTHWSAADQEQIYQAFKSNSVSSSSSAETIWGAIQSVKYALQKQDIKFAELNEMEILRIVDTHNATKKGVELEHIYEAKIVNWLKTPAGKAYINKKIDAPIAAHEVPIPMHDFDAGPLGDEQSYHLISLEDARADRAASFKKYGATTAEQKAALKKYTGGSYSSWNAAIRQGDISRYRADIVNEQMGMRPSMRPMLLRRGTSFLELNDPSIVSYETLLTHVGQTYINRGFMSTSVGGEAAFGGELLIEVEAPIGTPMAHVADFSSFKNERETTLAAHLVFRILSVKKKGYQTVMRVRVIGVGQP